MIRVFVGYDPREAVAFHTCVSSIIRNTSCPVSITPLALNMLSQYTETHTDGSNQFTYSRFLVPYLANYRGWAIFIDGDMIVRHDLADLWALREINKDVVVAKHDYVTKANHKYFNANNNNYPRKNWSSVVLWNCGSEYNRCLTPQYIQQASGEYLHRFQWLDDGRIGSLPLEWNWLADEYGENPDASLIHYTLGTPCFSQFANGPHSREWHDEYNIMTYHQE